MKKSILLLVATMAFANLAQAKSKATIITGKQAIIEVTGGVLNPSNDPLEADDCKIEVIRRGHDLEIKAKSKTENFSIEISEDQKYKLVEKTEGDDSQYTVKSLNGRESVTELSADDAFDRVTVVKNGAKVECEQDM